MLFSIHKKRRLDLVQGFSLIEISVVILIMGILLATVGPATYRWLVKGRENSTRASLNAVAQAINNYHAEIGSYPKELKDLVEKPTGAAGKKWTLPYLEKGLPEDSWNNEFHYKVTPGAEHPYELYSFGANGPDAPAEEHIDAWKS